MHQTDVENYKNRLKVPRCIEQYKGTLLKINLMRGPAEIWKIYQYDTSMVNHFFATLRNSQISKFISDYNVHAVVIRNTEKWIFHLKLNNFGHSFARKNICINIASTSNIKSTSHFYRQSEENVQ